MGDFNLNLLNEMHNGNVNEFVNNFNQRGFSNVILKPTRVNKNTATLIDHIWVNIDQINYVSNIIFTDISDHFPVTFHLNLKVKKCIQTITFRKSGNQCDIDFSERLRNLDFSQILECNDVNQAFLLFNNEFFSIYDQCYPLQTKTIKTNTPKKAWLTAGIRQSIKTKNKLYKKFVKRPITYGDAYRQFRNRLTKIIKSSKNNYYQQKFNDTKGNIKETWKNVNTLLGRTHTAQNRVFKFGSRYTDNPQIISNKFNDYFANIATSVVSDLDTSDATFEDFMPERHPIELPWEPTTQDEIKLIVNKSKTTNPGPDGIPMFVIKNNIDILSPIISNICNKSLITGIFPSIHKRGIITPIYKNKDVTDVSNYRPICLLNAISKILEKIVANRIMQHLEDNNLLSSTQYAYRKGMGTDLATTKFVKDILENFDNRKYTLSVFLDLTKAFDCVDHEILAIKLKYFGINNVSHEWLVDYLSNRKHYVKYQGCVSDERTVNIGVPQGSILGPILFLMYINDISRAGHDGDLLLFADDSNYYESSEDYSHLIDSVNRNLKFITKWFLSNKLAINIIKSEAMLFSRKKKIISY